MIRKDRRPPPRQNPSLVIIFHFCFVFCQCLKVMVSAFQLCSIYQILSGSNREQETAFTISGSIPTTSLLRRMVSGPRLDRIIVVDGGLSIAMCFLGIGGHKGCLPTCPDLSSSSEICGPAIWPVGYPQSVHQGLGFDFRPSADPRAIYSGVSGWLASEGAIRSSFGMQSFSQFVLWRGLAEFSTSKNLHLSWFSDWNIWVWS